MQEPRARRGHFAVEEEDDETVSFESNLKKAYFRGLIPLFCFVEGRTRKGSRKDIFVEME